jgi:hypothetical protein
VRPLRTRTDDRHLPAKHVEQLRQLIDAGHPEDATDTRHPVVLAREPRRIGVVVHVHRPELDDLEELAVETDPLLSEQDGTRTGHPNGESGDREERGREQEQE